MTPQRDQKIMEVFLAAVDLTDDRRADYLATTCENDQELRCEVESLLKHHVPDTEVAGHPDETRRSQTSTGASLSRSVVRSRLPRPKFGFIGFVLTVCFAVLWYVSHQAVQAKLRQNVESQLQTVLNADVAAIEIWLAKQTQMAETWASQSGVRATLSELARRSSQQKLTTAELESTDTHDKFLRMIGPLLAQPEIVFVGVFASDGHGIQVPSSSRPRCLLVFTRCRVDLALFSGRNGFHADLSTRQQCDRQRTWIGCLGRCFGRCTG